MIRDRRTTSTHIAHYDQIIAMIKLKRLQKVPETKGIVELKQILKQPG